MTVSKISAFEIINHGYMLPDYFPGCGTSFTEYKDAATGCGNNAKEAYEDALEQLAQGGWAIESLPTRPRGIRAWDRVPAECEESCWYVSVRVR